MCFLSAGRLRRACLDVGASSFATTRTSVVISCVLSRPTSSTATSRHPHPPSKYTISSCVRAYRSTSVSPLIVACLHYARRIIGAFFVTKRLRLWLPSGWPVNLYVAVRGRCLCVWVIRNRNLLTGIWRRLNDGYHGYV